MDTFFLCLLFLLESAAIHIEAAEVCYDGFGCFGNAKPYDNTAGRLPQSPQRIGTRFELYTAADAAPQSVDYADPDSVRISKFDSNRDTKILVHGFLGSSKIGPWMTEVKNSYLEQGLYNIILVDWNKGAIAPNYYQAAANSRLVGAQISKLIDVMKDEGLNLTKLHLIGLSLGAHVAGYAGRLQDGQIGRITGLEPAGPCFQSYDSEVHLDSTDALFVDVIHTNAAPFSRGGLGFTTAVGNVDFWANGGVRQPDCRGKNCVTSNSGSDGKTIDNTNEPEDNLTSTVSAVECQLHNNIITVLFKFFSCSHRFSAKLFISSITASRSISTAFPCATYDQFKDGHCTECGQRGCNYPGHGADPNAELGNQYFNTWSTTILPYFGYTYVISLCVQIDMKAAGGNIMIVLEGEPPSIKTSRVKFAPYNVHDFSGRTVTHVVVFDKDVGPVKNIQAWHVARSPRGETSTIVNISSAKIQHIPDGEVIEFDYQS